MQATWPLQVLTLRRYANLTYFNRQTHFFKQIVESLATCSSSSNIFDNLPALKPTVSTELEDELVTYLSTKRDLDVVDALRWWYERKHLYPHLYRMALDYLSIPGKLLYFPFTIGCSQQIYVSQPHLWMSNDLSARAGSYYHTFVVDCRFSQHVRFCALGCGVCWVTLGMMM